MCQAPIGPVCNIVGGVASPALANFALDGLETRLREKFSRSTSAGRQAKINLIKFADDFVITGSSKELLENEVKPVVEQFLAERGLELSPDKTVITHIEDGFDFLGQNIRKYNGKLIILIIQLLHNQSLTIII